MLRIITLLLIAALGSTSVKAERILETVLDPANPSQQNVAYRGKILIAGNSDTFMLSYDDVTFTRLNYPLVSGSRLRFQTSKNPLTLFESAIYFSLVRGTTTITSHLYRYAGGGFGRVPVPGNIVANCQVYAGNLYFLSNVSGTVKLFRYSGGIVSEVTGGAMPRSSSYELHVSAGNLYINGSGLRTGDVNFIRRFNGAGFFNLPWSGLGTNVQGVFGVPGTNRVYFTSHERILYFNGATVRQVFFNTGESVHARLWGNQLWFTTGIGVHPDRTSHLYRLFGADLLEISMPAGYQLASVGATNPEVYLGSLYIGAVFSDGSAQVLRHNGSAFESFFTIPTTRVSDGIHLFLREGNLMIHPNYVNGTNAFQYDGTKFEEIKGPADRLLFPYINSTNCNHLWLIYYSDASGIHWAYAKESKDCPPPPPPPGIPVIPEHFRDYERFETGLLGPDRGWCWSEIIIDWEIVPICDLPPCPPPEYQAWMMDANNGIQWFEQFNKPSRFTVPLPDEQPFRTVLTSINTKQDLLVFEPDLLPAGIEGIKINMRPKLGGFLLTTRTRNDKEVPLQVTLLNADGKVLWEQTFTAPFSEKITATVQEWGDKLIFSIPKLITKTQSSGGGGR